MIYPTHRFRYYLALLLLVLLGVLLGLSARAQEAPQPAARAAAYTRYLTQPLHLQPHQIAAVRHCTEQHLRALDSLAAQPAIQPADYARAEGRYADGMLPVLTPGQYAGFVLLQERLTATPPTSSAAASAAELH